jgi:azurin
MWGRPLGFISIVCTPLQADFDEMRRSMLIVLLAALAPARSQSRDPAPTELHISSDGDNLAFVPDRLRCPTGVRVRLFFRHRGEIIDDPHNWVLLKQGTEAAFLAIADRRDDNGVIPRYAENMVLAATPSCAIGQTVMVQFIPPAAGHYPFVCSVPGHGDTMRGILTVTGRVEDSHVQP